MRCVARFSCLALLFLPAAVLAAPPANARIEDAIQVKLEYDKITAEFNNAIRGKTGDVANYRTAKATRDAAVAALVKRAEAAKSQEHVPLAMAYQSLGRHDDAAREARAGLAEKKDFLTYTVLIGALCLNHKMDDAEKALAEAKEALGESERYVSLHQTMVSGYQLIKRDEEAAGHIAFILDGVWPSLVSTPDRYSKSYLRYLSELTTTKLQKENAAKILPILEKLEKRSATEAADNEKLEPIATAIKSAKKQVEAAAGEAGGKKAAGKTPAKTTARTTVRMVSDTKKSDANNAGTPGADKAAPGKTAAGTPTNRTPRTAAGNSAAAPTVSDEDLAAAQKRLAKDPKDKEALTTALRGTRSRMRGATSPEEYEKFKSEFNALIDKNLESMSDSAEFINAVSLMMASTVLPMISVDRFDEAEKALKEWKGRVEKLKVESDGVKTAVANVGRTIDQLFDRLEGARKRAALVGQPYFPIEEATWLNGSPLKPEELRGKVVLLDFWAVWCGPCVATFPHLKHWNEEYGDKGLVILGVTNRYHVDWDDEAKRIKGVDDLPPEKEDAATTKFVEHHGLKHRIAVMSERTLSGKYRVTGIPQAVLIDRQGMIRMIKVGSGEDNAKALEAAIRKALDLPVAKAS